MGQGLRIPGTVFMIAYQGQPPAGKLHPNLVAAAGVQADVYQGGGFLRQTDIGQSCFLHALPGPLDHIYLVLPAVLEKQILQNSRGLGHAP